MCSHVPIQVTTLGESSVTDLALIWLFSSVRSVVLSECRAISKAFAAYVTFVRPITRVGPHVSRHRAALRESSIADWTLEWFLSTVRPQMSSEIGRLSE